MFARLLLTALMVVASSPASGGAQARYFGFNDNSTLTHDLTPESDARLLHSVGANSVRIGVDWSYVELRPGALDLRLYDPIYRAWRSRGIRPVLIVTGAPGWARVQGVCAPDEQCHAPPLRRYDGAWATFVATVARRYPRAAAIEVWNEPNLGLFFPPRPDPVRYTELLRNARRAVKRVAPRMPVLGASLAGDLSDRRKPEGWGLRPFLRAMYGQGARGLMDGISVHAYPGSRAEGGAYEAIDATLEIRNDARDRAPLWLTEIGFTTAGGEGQEGLGDLARQNGSSATDVYSERAQAAVLGDLLPRLYRRPQVAGVFVHTLADPLKPEGTANDGFGLLRSDRSLKPAFCAVGHSRGALMGCSAPQLQPDEIVAFDAQERVQAAAEQALAQHMRTGTYRNLVLPSDSGVDVREVPGDADAVQLCDRLLTERTHCLTLVHGAQWQFSVTRQDGSSGTW